MKKERRIFLAPAMMVSLVVGAGEPDAWDPILKFSLEGGPYKETLIWISGFSYALSGQFARAKEGQSIGDCHFSHPMFTSKELVDILNARYEGQTITSEQATATLIKEVMPRHIICPKNEPGGEFRDQGQH